MVVHDDIDARDADGLTEALASVLVDMSAAPEGPCDSYRVDEVLKVRDTEVTEVVYFEGAQGSELGPYVRKRILATSGLGNAYELIWRRQRAGERYLHLPRILSVTQAGEQIDVVMEFIPGETLHDLVMREGASPALATRIMPAVCEAVRELHERFGVPIIHRDLKPSNIMALDLGPDRSPQITLVDFGIARAWREGAQNDTAHFGTRAYAPPEQFGFGQTDVRSDVYALGKVAFWCATGVEPPVSLSATSCRSYGLQDDLASVILTASAFDPAARYQTAGQLGTAFAELAAWGETNDRSPVRLERQGSDTRRGHKKGVEVRGRVRLQVKTGMNRASSAVGKLLSATPRWLGILWNAILALTLAALLSATVLALLDPTAEHLRHPRWFCVAEYLIMVDVPFALIAWGMADRRRTLARVPALGNLSHRFSILLALVVFLVAVLVLVLLGNAFGYVA